MPSQWPPSPHPSPQPLASRPLTQLQRPNPSPSSCPGTWTWGSTMSSWIQSPRRASACPSSCTACWNRWDVAPPQVFGTVNRGDFGKIFTIFHKYSHNDELNSKFHKGISKYHVFRATHIIYSILVDCYILKYLLLNLVQSYSGLRGDFGHPNIYAFPK